MVLLAALLLEPFDNGEFPRVMNILHDKPVDGLFVFGVYSRGFDELELDFLNVFLLGQQMADYCVDHLGCDSKP